MKTRILSTCFIVIVLTFMLSCPSYGELQSVDLRGLQEGAGWKGSLNAVKQVERNGRSAIEFNKRGQNIVWLDNFEFNEGIIANLKITHRAAETAQPAVPRWQPHDFAFTASEAADNPFEVGMSATIKGPDGQTFTLPGFYDGNNI